MSEVRSTLARWSVTSIGISILILSLSHIFLDNERVVIDLLEVVLPITFGCVLIWSDRWFRTRNLTDFEHLSVLAGGLGLGCFTLAGLIWQLTLLAWDGYAISRTELAPFLLGAFAFGFGIGVLLGFTNSRLHRARRHFTTGGDSN